MKVNCDNKNKVFKTSEASTKSWFRTKGLIDKYLNILDLNEFRKQNTKWSNYARIKYGVEARLFAEGHNGTRAIPNKQAFKKIDNAKGIYYQNSPAADNIALEATEVIKNRMKKFFDSIGVVYNPTTQILDREGNPVSAVAAADILKRTVSVIEGKMSVDTLPEEAAHFLIEMLPSDNSLYQALRKNIENTEIYRQTLEDYYTPYAGDLEKIAKEAMGKVIAQAIVNKVTKQEIPEDIKPKMNLINRIINWITSKVLKNPNAENDINEILSEYDRAIETLSETILAPSEIKSGVSELFESNPELANAVYEALGFKNSIIKISNKYELDKEYNLKSVLNNLLNTENENINNIYKALLNSIPSNLKLKYSKNIRQDAAGEYIYLEDTIKLNPNKLSHKTLIHEIIHALTHDTLLKNEKFNSKITVLRNQAVKYFEKNKPRAIQGSTKSALLSNDEFLAGLFNYKNLDFLNTLNNIVSENTTLLEKIKNVFKTLINEIANIAGIKLNKNSLLFEVINELGEIKISQITTQQKQQAQQLYSQYLDTIFPDSKVKDIVYHGNRADEKIETFKFTGIDKLAPNVKAEDNTGVFFTDDPFIAATYGDGTYAGNYKVLLNIKNPVYPNTETVTSGSVSKYIGKYDGVIGQEPDHSGTNFVVFEPEQIHILGSKQDLEGFREFIETSSSSKSEYLDSLNKPKGTINVYWGQPESETSTRVLSNLAPRKFTWEGREYGSVEHAYQSNKSGTFDKATYDAYNKLPEISANIPQNKVSGIESYGSLVEANNEAKKLLGDNPHSIDMIEAGLRTRTTRSESEMAKYAIKVGDTIKHFGKSADGTTKTVYAIVTAIHPKGSAGWKNTWEKEGWRKEDSNVIDKFKDGAAAIKFEVVSNFGYGKKIRGKGTVAEMRAADSLGLMKKLVVESFKQNPNSDAAKKLLQYENFTHNTNELIDKAFLEGLKLAQQELLGSKQDLEGFKEFINKSSITPINPLKTASNEALENLIMDLSASILTNYNHFNEVVRPLDDGKFKEQATNIRKLLNLNEEVDWNDPFSEIELEHRNKIGNKNIGIYAMALSGYNIFNSITNFAVYGSYAPMVDGKVYNSLTRKYDDAGELITVNFNRHLSSAVDNVKDPIASTLRDTPFTSPVTTYLLSLGFTTDFVNNLRQQPIIRELADMYENKQGTPNQLRRFVQELFNKYNNNPDIRLVEQGLSDFNINSEELSNSIATSVENDVNNQIKYLQFFYITHKAGRTLAKVGKVLMPDRISSMSTVSAIQEYKDLIDFVIGQKVIAANPIQEALYGEAFPITKAYHKVIANAYKFANLHMPFDFSGIVIMKNRLKADLDKDTLTAAQHDAINKDMFLYLLQGTKSPIKDMFMADKVSKILFSPDSNISSLLERMRTGYPKLESNLFFNKLAPHPNNTRNEEKVNRLRFENSYSYSKAERDTIIEEFAKLHFTPELYINESRDMSFEEQAANIKQFARILVMYTLNTTGFNNGADSFIEYIPTEIWSDYGVTEYYKNSLSKLNNTGDDILRTFAWIFVKNNLSLEGLISSVDIEKATKINKGNTLIFELIKGHYSPIYNEETGNLASIFSNYNEATKEKDYYSLSDIQIAEKGIRKISYKKMTKRGEANKFKEYVLYDANGDMVQNSIHPDNAGEFKEEGSIYNYSRVSSIDPWVIEQPVRICQILD